MEGFAKILVTLTAIVIILIVGSLWLLTRMTPETLEISRETSRIKAETELEKVKLLQQQQNVEAAKTLTDLEYQQQAQQTKLYQYSLAARYAFVNLWPAWAALLIVLLAYSQRHRFRKYVPYQDDMIDTMVRDGEQTQLAKQRYTLREQEAAQESLRFEAVESATNQRIKSNLDTMRTLKDFVKEPEHVETTVEAIPAIPANISEKFSMSDLFNDPDLEPGHLPLGRNHESGQIAQARPQDLMCIDLVGQQGCCKTTILNMLSLGFMKLQDEGADIEMYLIDPRSGVPKAAASFLKPVLHRFKQTVLGELAIEQGQHIELLQKIEQELNQRREQGYKTPYLVILIDEIYDSVDINDYAKECYRLLKKIRRLREAGVFQVLVHRDRAREGAGNLGTGLMNHSVSAFVVNCTKSKAVKVLENGAADKAVDLEKGQAVLKVPGGESELIRLPFPHPSDLLPFLAEHAGPAAQEHALTPDKVINFETYRNQPPLRQAAH